MSGADKEPLFWTLAVRAAKMSNGVFDLRGVRAQGGKRYKSVFCSANRDP